MSHQGNQQSMYPKIRFRKISKAEIQPIAKNAPAQFKTGTAKANPQLTNGCL